MLKSLIAFLQCVLNDLGTRCGISTSNDLKTIIRRSNHEGISFLTISLSNFGKDFEKSLDQGYVGHDQFLGFAKTGSLPRFLGGFFDLVFDRRGGRLLDIPRVESIQAIRQICLMFAKIEIPCTPNRERRAIDKYIEIEKEIRRYDQTLHSVSANETETNAEQFGRVGRLLWARLFSAVDNQIHNGTVVPKHGPGATADGLKGNRKFDQRVWTSRLEGVFPQRENIIPNDRPTFASRLDDVILLSPGAEIPAKVVLVPKTLKTPRIIAEEPTCMQYMQQGLLELMVDKIRGDDNASNFVMFESQQENQILARIGSVNGSLATLDLSEASDRVSNQHVRLLVQNHRALREALDATRSRKADVPGKGVIRLAKYASMGSALCFPLESLVFMTVIFVGIEEQLNRRLTKKDVESFYGVVRVFGDDIVVPVDYVQSVLKALETFGFRVNVHKSFWTGKFRESCGEDYYDGHDVKVVRVRTPLPRDRRDIEELVSTVSLRNQLFLAGFREAVDFLDEWIMRMIPFPIIESTSVLLGRLSNGPSQPECYDYDLHLPLVRGVTVVPKRRASSLDDSGALLKWFLKRGETPFEDKDHLQYSGRPVSARIKIRTAPPF